MGNVQLRGISQTRAGDKGNTVNIALFAPTREMYRVFLREVTAERVKAHFQGMVEGTVTRYEVPNLLALNFVCRRALNGGGSVSIRMDTLGKCFGSNLQRMFIAVPDDVLIAHQASERG
ncbi:MAG: AtuA-related protein [Bacilli bacterium]